jgi:hypothetical protein
VPAEGGGGEMSPANQGSEPGTLLISSPPLSVNGIREKYNHSQRGVRGARGGGRGKTCIMRCKQ